MIEAYFIARVLVSLILTLLPILFFLIAVKRILSR